MWGIIPAAGNGTRIQPLAFSKELLPVGSWVDQEGTERPRAVSEYLVDRMVKAGARKLCFVISPLKSDIVQYYGGSASEADIVYVVQAGASGLCDAIFRAIPVIPDDEPVLIGLPDTIWFPSDALVGLPDDRLSLLLFPVERPELFDAVLLDADDRLTHIYVKSRQSFTKWVWGAIKLPGSQFHALHELWLRRHKRDEYLGTLLNAWLADGGVVWGVKAGTSYVDVGTLHGYREAMLLVNARADRERSSMAARSRDLLKSTTESS